MLNQTRSNPYFRQRCCTAMCNRRLTLLLLTLILLLPHLEAAAAPLGRSNALAAPDEDYESDGDAQPDDGILPQFVTEEHTTVRESAAHTFELSCKARGRSSLKRSWYKNGIEVSKLHRRIWPYEVKGSSLWIKTATPDDDGNYTCIVENSAGKIERMFDVKVVSRIVAHRPLIKDGQPGNHTVLVGSDLSLQCTPDVFDIASPPLITWVKHVEVNGSLRDENGTLVVETLQSCAFHGACNLNNPNESYNVEDATVLRLVNLTVEQSGWYSCKVENDQGKSSSSGYVVVVAEFPKDPNFVESEKNRKAVLVILGIVAPSLMLCLGCSLFCWSRWKREEKKKLFAANAFDHVYQWTKVVLVERQQSTAGSTQPLLDPKVTIQKKMLTSVAVGECPPESDYELSPDPDWEVNRNDLSIIDTLGEGEFGKVVLAVTASPLRRQMYREEVGGAITVAVKTLKEGHTDGDLITLVKEMEIMKAIGFHPNIVNLLGVSTQPRGRPLLLILEFAENGNLKDFLISHRPPRSPLSVTSWYSNVTTSRDGYELPVTVVRDAATIDLKLMLKMAYEITKGMEFLSSRKCVHRDLAARNVLVTKDLLVKIADFGMARDVKSSDYYRKTSSGRVPLKWMAPEAIFEQVSTTKSDVWSFGVLLWEIVTLGESPYKGIPVDAFLEQLREGLQVMPQPVNCPDNLYEIMLECWKICPVARPSWPDMVDKLRKMYTGVEIQDRLVKVFGH